MPDTTQLVSSSLETGTSCSLLTGSNALVTTKYMDLKVHPVQLARDHSNTFCVFYATCMRSLLHLLETMHGTKACCTGCRVAEKLAMLLGTSPALPSRAGSAMHQALAQAASSNGHTYMSWDQLQPDALRLMCASGQSFHCLLARCQCNITAWSHAAAASHLCSGLRRVH